MPFFGVPSLNESQVRAIVVREMAAHEVITLDEVVVETGNEARPEVDVVIWDGGYEEPENFQEGDVWLPAEGTPPGGGGNPEEPTSVGVYPADSTDAPASGLAADAEPSDEIRWAGQQFYLYGEPPYTGAEIVGVRLFVPSGGAAVLTGDQQFIVIKKTENVGTYDVNGPAGIWQGQDDLTVPFQEEYADWNGEFFSVELGERAMTFSQTLVDGWNTFMFAAPIPLAHLQGAAVLYRIGAGGIVVTTTPPSGRIEAEGVRLAIGAPASGQYGDTRAWTVTGPATSVNNFDSNLYGLDLLVSGI